MLKSIGEVCRIHQQNHGLKKIPNTFRHKITMLSRQDAKRKMKQLKLNLAKTEVEMSKSYVTVMEYCNPNKQMFEQLQCYDNWKKMESMAILKAVMENELTMLEKYLMQIESDSNE